MSKARFIVSGPFDKEMPDHYLVIADLSFWLENEIKIYDWMDLCLPKGRAHHQGMCVILPSAEYASAFLLRWG